MKALLIDDELSNLENLQQLLQAYCPDVEVCAVAENVDDAIKTIARHKPDLVFLDIQLHQQTGFDLLTQLGHIDFELIFVTAYNQYGIQAIKFAALDYLLKPIDIDELQNAVKKAHRAINQKQDSQRVTYLLEYLKDNNKAQPRIALPLFAETRYLNISDITRCQADNTYTRFILANDEQILVSKILKEYAAMLLGHGFVRVHQSHLVNMAYIKSWLREDGGSLLMADETRIPVSKQNREKVKEIIGLRFNLR